MTVTVVSFRAAFPEFTDAPTYPQPEIQFWLDLSAKLLNSDRWGELLDFGAQLFVAHNLCLQAASKTGAAGGGLPGQVVGPTTSASVDKVSYSRDASSAMDPANGHWNLSTYGLRYKQLLSMIGAGPIQVGAPTAEDGFYGAWNGPFV